MQVVFGAKTICFIGLSLTRVLCVQFSFTPQNTVINQPAVFQCSVDTEGVTIQWTVNGYSSTSSFITNQSIVTEGVGTQNSKLTIPGDPTLNGTRVTCIGSGVANEEHYINSSSAVLYIQVVQVSFTPSHNTILNQPAVYQCSVDTDGVIIQWTVNGYNSTSSFITNHRTVSKGVGTQNSELTIPGDPTLNGTTVTCIASGVVNGKQYFNSNSARLYIQGPPQAVDIICTSSLIKTLYVKCTWTVPYTIEGVKITYYTVNITKDEQILHNDSVNDTHYSYLSGTYTVSVAAVVGDTLEGEINSWEVNVSKVIPVDYQCNVEVLKVNGRNKTWMANYILIMGTQFITDFQPSQVYACFHLLPGSTVSEFNCEYYYETNINTPSRRKIVGTVDLEGMQDKQKGEITFFAEYETGLQVMSNDSCTASTFDLQRVDVSQDFFGKVCFQCFYVIGSSTRGCFIEYTCSVDDVYGNFSISKPDKIKCLVSKYFRGYCIVKAFDIESDGRVYSSGTADKQTFSIKENEITRTRIYVLTSFPMALSSVIAATSIPEPSKGNFALIISLSTCSSVIFIIAMSCIVVFIVVKMETSKKKGSLQLNNIELKFNYQETIKNCRGSKPSLNEAENTYCDIEFQQIEHENYSRLDHNRCTYYDSDMYSTLQHGTKKPAPAFCNPALVDTYSTIKLGNADHVSGIVECHA